MKKPQHIVTISKPCSENWGSMPPAEKGRYCSACSKVVTDFTTMSDAEIIRVLNERKGRTCGNFYEHQLNRVFVTVEAPKQAPFFYRVLAGLLLLTGTAAEAVPHNAPYAQVIFAGDTKPNKNEQHDKNLVPPLTGAGDVNVSGTIKDKSGAGQRCTIMLENTTFWSESDNSGSFNFTVPERLVKDEMVFKVYYFSVEDTEFKVLRTESPAIKNVTLTEKGLGRMMRGEF